MESESKACMDGAWYAAANVAVDSTVVTGAQIGKVVMRPGECAVLATADGDIRWVEDDGTLVLSGDVVARITVAAPPAIAAVRPAAPGASTGGSGT